MTTNAPEAPAKFGWCTTGHHHACRAHFTNNGRTHHCGCPCHRKDHP